MKISTIIPSQRNAFSTTSNSSINFTSKYGTKAFEIEKALAEKNISCEFKDNNFVAECAEKTVKIFKQLFGEKLLPRSIDFDNIPGAYGAYSIDKDSVIINSSLSCFNSKKELATEMAQAKNVFFLPDEKSTIHYLRTFIHEFGHSAHLKNLQERNLDFVGDKLRNTKIPNVVGRLITKFKLGKYSATNMNEFMAERIAKDIVKNLNKDDEYIGSPLDVKYSDIFERKWNCRYITPQSYIDYFTQQVWNGDVEGTEKAVAQMKNYLQAIQIVENPLTIGRPAIVMALKTIERPKEEAAIKKVSFWGIIDAICGKLISTPNCIEKKNQLKIRLED